MLADCTRIPGGREARRMGGEPHSSNTSHRCLATFYLKRIPACGSWAGCKVCPTKWPGVTATFQKRSRTWDKKQNSLPLKTHPIHPHKRASVNIKSRQTTVYHPRDLKRGCKGTIAERLVWRFGWPSILSYCCPCLAVPGCLVSRLIHLSRPPR